MICDHAACPKLKSILISRSPNSPVVDVSFKALWRTTITSIAGNMPGDDLATWSTYASSCKVALSNVSTRRTTRFACGMHCGVLSAFPQFTCVTNKCKVRYG